MSKRKRSSNRNYKVFRLAKTGWIVLASISFEQGERDRQRGMLERVNDAKGNHVGYRRRTSPKFSFEPSGSHPSSTVFSKAENAAIAFSEYLNAGSKTAALPEHEKLQRVNRRTLLPEAEDLVEKAIAKLAEWTEMHDDRAVRVYPARV